MRLSVDDFSSFLGVDQTGAVTSSGRPKKLPAAVLKRRADYWVLSIIDLPEFRSDFILDFVDHQKKPVWVSLDCVLGLPDNFKKTNSPRRDLLNYLNQAASHPGYGRRASEDFFGRLLSSIKKKTDALPRRRVEEALGSNSVFQTRPFQKNIQTGTFRLWKDIARDSKAKWYYWPFETRAAQPKEFVVAEAYPTLAWRLLNNSQRISKDLRPLFRRFRNRVRGLKQLKDTSADHRDAAMIALLAFELMSRKKLKKPRFLSLEGAILGEEQSFEAATAAFDF